jgi:hypothetical protein
MTTIDKIDLTGLATPPLPETRALAHLDVHYNNNVYKWLLYIPLGNDWQTYIDNSFSVIQAQIDAKELAWTNLSPKTRTTEDGIVVDIDKSEIVFPDQLDYVALRRASYPAIGDQLDAILKGTNDPNYQILMDKISSIKTTYQPVIPNPVSGDDVDNERDRRRYLQYTVTLQNAGKITVNMDAISQSNIQALTTIGLYLASAAPTKTTVFRDYSNNTFNLTPSELISMGLQVAGYIQAMYVKSWALKAMSTIPTNYTQDSYWT